jgi:hypothetical protein
MVTLSGGLQDKVSCIKNRPILLVKSTIKKSPDFPSKKMHTTPEYLARRIQQVVPKLLLVKTSQTQPSLSLSAFACDSTPLTTSL